MLVQIRAATIADADTIAEYNARLAWETETKALDRPTLAAGVRAVLADPTKGRYLLADHAGQVVGQLMVTFEWSDWRNGYFWWLQSVYVRSDARQAGVFRALFAALQAEAHAAGNVIGLRLYVEQHNHAAQLTYQRLGLTATEYQLFEQCPLLATATRLG
jgi:GNAT superfamily N-acetyltransferase